MILRYYQIKAIEQIKLNFAKNNKRLVLCAPTGAGKTVIFSSIAKQVYQKNKRVLIITNRKELLKQSGNKLNEFGLVPFLLTAKEKTIPVNSVVVGMVETIKRRLTKPDYINFIQSFDLIIIDECHLNSFNKLFTSLNENQFVIGASATPYRTGKMPELKEFYDTIVDVCQVSELVNDGFLSSPEVYGVPVDLSNVKIKGNDFDESELSKFYDNEKLYTGIVENYKTHANGLKTLVFCASIKNSEKLCAEMQVSGINAKHFDCYKSDSERNEILNWFENTPDAVLCNVGILTTGFDSPSVRCVALYRATKSLPLYLQMVGRGSRVLPDKKTFKILDFGNNVGRFGYWENDRIWSLENDKKPLKKEKKVSPMKNCPNCDALLFASTKTCKYCGFVYESENKEQERIFAILEKLTPSQVQQFANNCSIFELEEVRKIKGYKLGWICHRLRTLEEFKEYEQLRGFKKGWAKINFENFGNNKN